MRKDGHPLGSRRSPGSGFAHTVLGVRALGDSGPCLREVGRGGSRQDMVNPAREPLMGVIEVDDTYVSEAQSRESMVAILRPRCPSWWR